MRLKLKKHYQNIIYQNNHKVKEMNKIKLIKKI